MAYKTFIEYPTGTFTNVDVVGLGSIKLSNTRDIDDIQIYFRPKIGSVSINGAGWLLLQTIERDEDCNTATFNVHNNCGEEIYKATFSKEQIEFDFQQCIATLKLDTKDRYTCVLENQKVEQKAFLFGVFKTVTSNPILMQEFHVEVYQGQSNYPSSVPGWTFVSEHYTHNIGPSLACNPADEMWMAIYTRDYILTEIVGGIANKPSDSTFTFLSNVVVGANTFAKWIRKSTIVQPIYFSRQPGGFDPCLSEWNSIYFAPVSDTCDSTLYFLTVCASNATTYTIDHCMTLESVINGLYSLSRCHERLPGIVRSDFFEWNPVGDAPGYAPGINYVYGGPNEYSNLIIAQKSDVTKYNASNNAGPGSDLITLEKVFKFLYNQFQVYWFIDDDSNLRIEHISYFYQNDKNILCDSKILNPYGNLPKTENWRMMEAYNIDFVGVPIRYECFEGNKRLYDSETFSTELEQALLNPDGFSNSGWFVLACDGSDQVINDYGILSLQRHPNSPMAISRLHDRFWKHFRYNEEFEMNLITPTSYVDILHPAYTTTCVNSSCCDIEDDIKQAVTTNFMASKKPNRKGLITEIEYDLRTQTQSIKINY